MYIDNYNKSETPSTETFQVIPEPEPMEQFLFFCYGNSMKNKIIGVSMHKTTSGYNEITTSGSYPSWQLLLHPCAQRIRHNPQRLPPPRDNTSISREITPAIARIVAGIMERCLNYERDKAKRISFSLYTHARIRRYFEAGIEMVRINREGHT